MAESTRSLANRLTQKRRDGISRHQGVVQVVGTNVIDITLDGGTTPITGVKYMAMYTPAVGDTVEVIKDGNDLFVLGVLA